MRPPPGGGGGGGSDCVLLVLLAVLVDDVCDSQLLRLEMLLIEDMLRSYVVGRNVNQT